tara:strand:+ start:390 stop:1274 length:885 start_codon:yes stop_codon:yes gene_type:complete
MKIYLLSPESVPMNQVLFPTFGKTFRERGHEFVSRIEDCDVVFFDLHTRIADYNQHDIDFAKHFFVPIVTFDEWDRGGMSSEVWPLPLTEQQKDVFWYNGDRKFVNFCRLLDKTKQHTPCLYPYEKPILFEEPLLTPDELFHRYYDICYIANQSPSRDAIAKALLEDGRLKCYILIGGKKLEFSDFLKRHKNAKLFISSGAGGFTDERVQCLFSVAGIIRERSNQLLLHDFIHQENCLRIDNPPTKQDLDNIFEVVNNKERLYEIYKNGYDFVKKFYSKEYIATNILETIKKHL